MRLKIAAARRRGSCTGTNSQRLYLHRADQECYPFVMSEASLRSVGGSLAPSGPLSRVLAAVLHAARRLSRPAGRAERVELELPDFEAWSCRVGRGGATVLCARGSLWITREGDLEDHLLLAGEAFESEKPGRIAVVGLGAARVVVSGDLRRPPRA
jgi:hypothetical protein